jgi:prepilin-type N-terminal cleavage/methylation domain-containing protein
MKTIVFPHQQGFGLIEIIVAMGLFVIIAATAAVTVVGSFSTNRLGNEETEAALLAQEGVEAARSLRTQDWDTVFLGTDCTSGCGLASGGGSWVWSGSSSTVGPFTRVVTVSDVNRDGSGNIAVSGTDDPDTKLVTATVSWDFTPTRQNTVEYQAYITNFFKAINTDLGFLDLSGTGNANDVHVVGDYAYVARSGSPDLSVINISDPYNIVLEGTIDLPGNPLDVHVVGNYAYLASANNNQELQVVDISNPSSPSQVGSLGLSGNANAFTIKAVGSTVYVGRDSSGQPELYVISVSNPAAPSIVGTLEVGADVNNIAVVGNYVYMATDANNAELRVADVSNPAAPSSVGTVNLSGNNNAESVAANASNVVVGRANGNVYTFSLPSATNPTLQGNYDANSFVNDIALHSDGNTAYLATNDNTGDYQSIDITNLASPTQVIYADQDGNLNGIFYDSTTDKVIGVGDSNTREVELYLP